MTLRFCFQSDGIWSDDDGFNPTTCGAFAVDNIVLSGGVSHFADFESGDDGWDLVPTEPGPGDWSRLLHLDDLPDIPSGVAGTCTLNDSVLVLFEPDGEKFHPLEQENVAVSPWIDLKRAAAVGFPSKLVQIGGYFDLPTPNYVFTHVLVQWYPDTCQVTGFIGLSDFKSSGYVYSFGGAPICLDPSDPIGYINFSSVLPENVEQVRIAVGVLNYCRFFDACTGLDNTTPWFDNVRFAVHTVNTLQTTIAEASDGDTLWIPRGLYRGEGNRDLDFGGKNLVLIAPAGPENTIIDCQGLGRGFIFQSGEDSTSIIDGLTIRNGVAPPGEYSQEDGGGIYAAYGTWPTIRNCIIENCSAYRGGGMSATRANVSGCTFRSNTASIEGGGIAARRWDGVVIDNSTFTNNSASFGGAISNAFLVRDCEISDNMAGNGGGIHGAYRVEHCTLIRNTATSGGGDANSSYLVDCVISENVAAQSGGGLYLAGGSAIGCLIQGNTAESGGGATLVSGGGGQWPFPSRITDCTITGNVATQGGGIVPYGGSTITSCTFSANDATQGGAIFVPAWSEIEVSASILWGNCARGHRGEQLAFGDSTATIELICSAIDTSGIYGDGTVLYSGPQVFTDPLLCDPAPCVSAPTTAGDYSLIPGSPCLPVNSPCSSLIGASGEICQTTGPPPEDSPPVLPGLTAYPNPFSRQLTIAFSAPENTPTSIRIFDVRGRVVRTYTLEIQEGNFTWDGRDERGTPISPGVYFIRMRAGPVERVTRAVLVP